MLAGPPLAFVFSLVGVFKDTRRSLAIAGLVISGLSVLFLGGALLGVIF